jgi:putative addiction module component (TIGR02574 family)
MSDFDSLFADARQLPLEERLQFIDALWSTVPDDAALALSGEWMAEIQRRSDEYDAGLTHAVSWKKVRSQALRRAGVQE